MKRIAILGTGVVGDALSAGFLKYEGIDGESKDVKIHGYWLAFPQHTTYLVVETDDISHLQRFLRPGAGLTTCEITPVSDQPAPLPGS